MFERAICSVSVTLTTSVAFKRVVHGKVDDASRDVRCKILAAQNGT